MNEEPDPPSPNTDHARPKPNYDRRIRVWSTLLIVSAIGVVVPPLIGLSGTLIGMGRSFSEASSGATQDPEALADSISFSLVATAIAIPVSIAFLLLFVISFIFWLISLSARKNEQSK